MPGTKGSSPSAARRDLLRQNVTVNEVMNSVKIEKYFALAARTLSRAQEAYAKARVDESARDFEAAKRRYADLNECYVFYQRYGRLALHVIPSHNYYNSPQHADAKRSFQKTQGACLSSLEAVVRAMDADQALIDAERARLCKVKAERDAREKAERERRDLEARLEREARDRERRERDTRQRLKEQLLAEERARRNVDPPAPADVPAPAYVPVSPERAVDDVRVQTFAQDQRVLYDDRGTWQAARVVRVHLESVPPYYTVHVLGGDRPREVQTEASKLRPVDSEPAVDSEPGSIDALPLESFPEVVKPAPLQQPPPQQPEDSDARMLGAAPLVQPQLGLDGGLGLDDVVPPAAPTPPPATQPERRTRLPFRELRAKVADEWRRANGRVENLSTYQGRVRDARGLDSTNGCAVIAPLTCYQHVVNKGASNDDISTLIDTIVPPILSHVRKKHGLGSGAFIIPSDVHDYLYDQGAISRDMFEGVYGGDVLDDDHLGNLLNALENVPASETAACAFFFKEHVTAVLRVANKRTGNFEYHFLDSMPGARGLGTRTLCPDAHALRVYLKHYAIQKLAGYASVIDNNDWNDAAAEFDPRVFQAFVWRK